MIFKDHKQIMLSFPTVANFFPEEENLAIQTSSLCLERIAIVFDGSSIFEQR